MCFALDRRGRLSVVQFFTGGRVYKNGLRPKSSITANGQCYRHGNLKKSDATKSVVVLPDNGTVVTEAIPGSGNSTGDINERSQASNT
jgi:hypothetical protein